MPLGEQLSRLKLIPPLMHVQTAHRDWHYHFYTASIVNPKEHEYTRRLRSMVSPYLVLKNTRPVHSEPLTRTTKDQPRDQCALAWHFSSSQGRGAAGRAQERTQQPSPPHLCLHWGAFRSEP